MTIKLPDVSEFQAPANGNAPDWAGIKSQNGGAAIIRVGYGNAHLDEMLVSNRAKIRPLGFGFCGLYQYLRADQDVTSQASAFINWIGPDLQQLVQAGEAGRPVDEVGDVLSPLRRYPRQHVDQDDLADQFGCLGGQRDGGEAAERHADRRLGGGGELADGGRDVDRVAVRVQLAGRQHRLSIFKI